MKRLSSFSKRTWILVGVVAVIAAMASFGAYAYWTTSGTGNGSATTDTSQAVTVSQLAPSPSNLVPGGPAQDVDLRVTNPASFNQYVADVTVAVANTDGSAWSDQADGTKPACTAADFTVTGSPVSVATDLTPGDHDYTGVVTLALKDTALNQDNCKNVSVPLHFVANAS